MKSPQSPNPPSSPLPDGEHHGDAGSAQTVYVIDAEAAVRDELGRLFGLHRYRTALFAGAADFISAWRGHRGGCVVLDSSLPAVDGLSLQRRLAVLGCELPVIVIGSDADFHQARAAFRANAVDFIPKPIDHTRLLSAVREALQRSEAMVAHRWRHQEAMARLRELARAERALLDLGVTSPGVPRPTAAALSTATPAPAVATVMQAGGAPQAPRPPLAASSQATAHRIVVLEPHPLLRVGLEAVLHGTGLGRPLAVATLHEAMQALRDAGAALLIADAESVAADECAGLLALREAAGATPLMVTAHKMPVALARACFAAGARGFVEKAVAPDQMAWAIEVMLRGGQFLPEALTSELAAQAGDGSSVPGYLPEASVRPAVPAGPPDSGALPAQEEGGVARDPAIDCSRITGRQRDVARLLAAGLSNKEIARELNISLGTAKNYVAQILGILGAKSRSRAATLMLSHKAVAASVREFAQERGTFVQ
jgi:DNA-binding NarL/FixJ family response regulator